jgi:hypothetical protein
VPIIAIVVLVFLLAPAGALMIKAYTEGLAEPWDVTVTAAESPLSMLNGCPVILVTVTNPGPIPVLVGLRVQERLLLVRRGAKTKTRVPLRPIRRRYRANWHTDVGVVPPDGSTHPSFRVAAAAGRSFSVVAAVGRSDHRLRVISVPVSVSRAPTANEAEIAIIPLLGWLFLL